METAAASFASSISAPSTPPLLSLLQEEAVALQRGVLLRQEAPASYEAQQGKQGVRSSISRLHRLWGAAAPHSHTGVFPSAAVSSVSSVSAPACAAAATSEGEQQQLRQQQQAAALRTAVENYEASFSRSSSTRGRRAGAAADVRRRNFLLLQQQQQEQSGVGGLPAFGAAGAASLQQQQQHAGAAGSAYGVNVHQHTRLQQAYALVGSSLQKAAQEDLLRAAAADAVRDAAQWRRDKRLLLRQLQRAAETPLQLLAPPSGVEPFFPTSFSLGAGPNSGSADAAAAAAAAGKQLLLPLTRAELRCIATLLQWQQQQLQTTQGGNAVAVASASSIPLLAHVLLPLPAAAAAAWRAHVATACHKPAHVSCSCFCPAFMLSHTSSRDETLARKEWSQQQQQRYSAIVQAILGCCYFLVLQQERQQQQQSPGACAAAELVAAATGAAAAEADAAAAPPRTSLLRWMTSNAVAALEGERSAQVEQALSALTPAFTPFNFEEEGAGRRGEGGAAAGRGGGAGSSSSGSACPVWRAAALWLRLSIALQQREEQQQQHCRGRQSQQQQEQWDQQQQQEQRRQASFFGGAMLLMQHAASAAAADGRHVEETEAFACWWRALYLIFRTGNLQVLLLLATGNFMQQQPQRECSWVELAAAAAAAAAAPAHAQQGDSSLWPGDEAAAAGRRTAGARAAIGGTSAASAAASALEEEVLNYPRPPFFAYVARQLLLLLLETSAAAEQRKRILCELRARDMQAAQDLQQFYAALPAVASLESSCSAAVKAQLLLLYPPGRSPAPPPPAAAAGTEEAAAAMAEAAATDPHLLLLLSLIYPDAWPPINIARMLPNASQEDFLHYRLLLSLSVSGRSFAPEETLQTLLQQLAEKLRQQGPAFFLPGAAGVSSSGGGRGRGGGSAAAAVAATLQQQQDWERAQQQEEEENTLNFEEENQVNLVYPCMLAWTGCCVEAVEWLLQQPQQQSSFLRRACLLLLLLLYQCGAFNCPVLLRLQQLSASTGSRQQQGAAASASSLLSLAAAAAEQDEKEEAKDEEDATAAAEQEKKGEEDGRFLLLRAFQLSVANSSALACLNFLQLFPAAYCRSLAGWVAGRHFLSISSSLFLGDLSADGSSIQPGLLVNALLLPLLVNEEDAAEEEEEQQLQLLQQEGAAAGDNSVAAGFWYNSSSNTSGGGLGGADGCEQQFLLLLRTAAASASDGSAAAASQQQQQPRLQPQQQQLLRCVYAAIRNEGERRRAVKESFIAAWLLDDYRSCMQLTEDALEAAACAPALHHGQLPNDAVLRQTAGFFLSAFELLKRRVLDGQRMQQLLGAWQQTRIALCAAAGDCRGALSLYLQAQQSRSSALLWLPGVMQQHGTNYVFPLRFAALVEVITHVLLKLLGQRIPLEQLISFQELLLLQQVAAALPLTASSHLVEARASLKELLKQYRKFPSSAADPLCL